MKVENNNYQTFGVCTLNKGSLRRIKNKRHKNELLRVTNGLKSILDNASENTNTIIRPYTDKKGNVTVVHIDSHPENNIGKIIKDAAERFVDMTKRLTSGIPVKIDGHRKIDFYDFTQEKLIKTVSDASDEIKVKYNI